MQGSQPSLLGSLRAALVNTRPAWIITRREISDQLRDWRIILPVFFLTIFFPGLMNFTAGQLVDFVERYNSPLIGDRLMPFLLMIVGFFPISVSLVIALESFVGEKERHSIEPLLSSPLTDTQLFLGKLAAATVPPVLLSYLGIAVYLFGVYLDVSWRPPPALLLQVILLSTVQAVVMVSGAVVISTQTTSVRAANLLSSFIVVPMALLIQGESVVMFWGDYSGLWWIIAGLAVIAGVLVRTGMAHFNREELLGRELDTINLRWGWGVFIEQFRGEGRGLKAWYRTRVWPAARQLGIPMAMMVLAIVVSGIIGARLVELYPPPPELISLSGLNAGFMEELASTTFFSTLGAG
ncbi:MAG TPA: ABC transporter permease subunit, partial [Anaerolineales bacterium]|nr:ABC transporter permease subunit [Anaerolineales bacterium]